MNTLLILLAISLSGLLLLKLQNRRQAARIRLINESKRRIEARKSEDTFKNALVQHKEVIEYNTDFSGLEVTDLSEEQAEVIRKIFDNQHPVIKHREREHAKDFWATTGPAYLA